MHDKLALVQILSNPQDVTAAILRYGLSDSTTVNFAESKDADSVLKFLNRLKGKEYNKLQTICASSLSTRFTRLDPTVKDAFIWESIMRALAAYWTSHLRGDSERYVLGVVNAAMSYLPGLGDILRQRNPLLGLVNLGPSILETIQITKDCGVTKSDLVYLDLMGELAKEFGSIETETWLSKNPTWAHVLKIHDNLNKSFRDFLETMAVLLLSNVSNEINPDLVIGETRELISLLRNHAATKKEIISFLARIDDCADNTVSSQFPRMLFLGTFRDFAEEHSRHFGQRYDILKYPIAEDSINNPILKMLKQISGQYDPEQVVYDLASPIELSEKIIADRPFEDLPIPKRNLSENWEKNYLQERLSLALVERRLIQFSQEPTVDVNASRVYARANFLLLVEKEGYSRLGLSVLSETIHHNAPNLRTDLPESFTHRCLDLAQLWYNVIGKEGPLVNSSWCEILSKPNLNRRIKRFLFQVIDILVFAKPDPIDAIELESYLDTFNYYLTYNPDAEELKEFVRMLPNPDKEHLYRRGFELANLMQPFNRIFDSETKYE